MNTIEQRIIANARHYAQTPKPAWRGQSDKHASWLETIHQHFIQVVEPQFTGIGERFIEYWPIWFLWGEGTQFRRAITSSRAYTHLEGTFGTGYITLTDGSVYMVALTKVSEAFPMFDIGLTKDFVGTMLRGMMGEIDSRRMIKQDKTFPIAHSNIVGAQILENNHGHRSVDFTTVSVKWSIDVLFTDTEQEIATALQMARQGKLSQIWSSPPVNSEKQLSQEVLDLLKKLGELRQANVITEEEFEAKKHDLLSRL